MINYTQVSNITGLTENPFNVWDFGEISSSLIDTIHMVSPGPVYLDRISNNVCYFKVGEDDYAFVTIRQDSVSPIYSMETGGIVGSCSFGTDSLFSPTWEYTLKTKPYVNPHFVFPVDNRKVLTIRDTKGNVTSGAIEIVNGEGVAVTDSNGLLTISFPFSDEDKSKLKAIRFRHLFGAGAVPSDSTEGEVDLGYQGMTLEEVCVSKATNLPDSNGIIPPNDPPGTGTGAPATGGANSEGSFDITAEECRGSVTINSMGGSGGSRLRVEKVDSNTIRFRLIG